MSKIVQEIKIYFLSALNSNLENIKKVRLQVLQAGYNTTDFHITVPTVIGRRYTGLIILCHQEGYLTGLYALCIRMEGISINKIIGVDASVAVSNDIVTVTYSQTSIWASGLLILPEEVI